MNYQTYEGYTAEMFVSDDSFRKWVKNPTPVEEAFWQAFLTQYPQQKVEVEKAKAIIRAIEEYYAEAVTTEEMQASFAVVQQRAASAKPLRVAHKRRWQAWQIAASIILLVSLSALSILYLKSTPEVNVYATDFGKREEVMLPDGSVVQLNANSTLRVSEKWETNTAREVWLEGEAYFSVKKIPSAQAKFIVHTSSLNVEVYGTQFNVNARKEKTEVVLEEGKVQVVFSDQKISKDISMIPGEVVTYDATDKKVKHQKEPTQQYTSWKDGFLVFESADLAAVAKRIGEIYKIHLIIPQESIQNLPIKASLPTDNLTECLETLELLLLSEGVALKYQGRDTVIVQ
ncbi:MAG: FecR family protein [Saprospiraceae bacterium]